MTPEEKAVIKAAQRWAWRPDSLIDQLIHDQRLASAVQALKISRQPEHTVAPLPCGAPSRTGAMLCELPGGHDPDGTLTWRASGFARLYAARWHAGRAKDGSDRMWREDLTR